MENIILFVCGKCRKGWKSNDDTIPEGSKEGEKCPDCGSDDINGYDI